MKKNKKLAKRVNQLESDVAKLVNDFIKETKVTNALVMSHVYKSGATTYVETEVKALES